MMVLDWLQRRGGSAHPVFLKTLKRIGEMHGLLRFEAKGS